MAYTEGMLCKTVGVALAAPGVPAGRWAYPIGQEGIPCQLVGQQAKLDRTQKVAESHLLGWKVHGFKERGAGGSLPSDKPNHT